MYVYKKFEANKNENAIFLLDNQAFSTHHRTLQSLYSVTETPDASQALNGWIYMACVYTL